MTIFFARFDGPGLALEQRRDTMRDQRAQLTEEGWQPIEVPSWVEFGQWTQVRRLDNGGVEFDFPPHVRRWDAFKDALVQDARSQAVTQAAFSHPELGTALTLFLSAIDTLDQRATSERLVTFHRMWLAFRGFIESLTTAQVLEPGIVDRLKAIALTFEIELPDELPDP